MRGDIPCSQMADLFERRKPHYPVSDAFGERVKGVPVSEWSRTERTHMVDWFRANETCGDGDYTRETPNESAKRCYNRLQAPESLLWIAEAVGISRKVVEKAAEEALKYDDRRPRCKAIREVIPWSAVYERAIAMM